MLMHGFPGKGHDLSKKEFGKGFEEVDGTEAARKKV